MSKGKMKYWYRADASRGAKVSYILAAESVAKAREQLGLLAGKRIITALTWTQISRFTGCEIPEKHKSDDFAHGSLLFRTGDFCWYLWIDNYSGG